MGGGGTEGWSSIPRCIHSVCSVFCMVSMCVCVYVQVNTCTPIPHCRCVCECLCVCVCVQVNTPTHSFLIPSCCSCCTTLPAPSLVSLAYPACLYTTASTPRPPSTLACASTSAARAAGGSNSWRNALFRMVNASRMVALSCCCMSTRKSLAICVGGVFWIACVVGGL